MPQAVTRYAVRLLGKNFPIVVDDKLEIVGFYTTRFVDAENVDQAELAAVKLIKSDESLISTVKKVDDFEPMIYVDEIWEAPTKKLGGGGYTWFPMEANDA